MIEIPKDALDDLIVKEPENPNQLVADVIRGYIKLTTDGSVLFEPIFYNEPEWKRILIVCIGKKALFVKSLITAEEITLKELSNLTSVPRKNVTRALTRELKGVIQRGTTEGIYTVPNYNLLRAKKLIEEKTFRKKVR